MCLGCQGFFFCPFCSILFGGGGLICYIHLLLKLLVPFYQIPCNHRRTGQHPFGGGGRPSFARMDSVRGGGSSRNFPGSIFCGGGGGVVAEIFRDPYSVGWQNFFR